MIIDENEPQRRQDYTLGEKLDDFSISELEELKTRLQEEIVRVDVEAMAKRATKDAAASIFKK